VRVLFAGTPQAAVPSLEALLAAPHEVVAVVTRPDAAAGRGRNSRALVPSPVAAAAEAAGVPVFRHSSARSPEFADLVAGLGVDVAAVVAYGALIPQRVLDLPPHGWVNLHFSLLPAWRGAAPVQAAIRAGDEITGASTFRLEAGLDTGPVYGLDTETIRPTDTTGELLDRLAHSGAALLAATIDGIADGTVHPVPQPTDGVSHAAKVSPADVRIDWNRPAVAIDRLVRSATPEPGAWTESPWGRIGLGPVSVLVEHDGQAVPDLGPGELAVEKRRVLVGTAGNPVVLGTVTAPGRKPMPATDWARGTRPEPGTVLG